MGDITEGTTLLEALQNTADGKNILYNERGEVSADIDAVIVAVGEDPYAEMQGDRSSSNLTITKDDKILLDDLKAFLEAAGKKDIPVIAVLFTGRPVIIADYVEDFDAIVDAKDSKTVVIYYAPGAITDDGAANRTVVPMTRTEDLIDYQDFTLDVTLEEGSYEFKFMNGTSKGADSRLDRIEFEYLD